MNPNEHHSPSSALALLISILALIVALSGTAYAALGAGSVGTKQLAKSAVTKAKIKKQAVSSTKLADGSVTTPKLTDGSVTTPKLANGSVTAPKLTNGSVGTATVADGSLSLSDLGGVVTNQTTTLVNPVAIEAGACANLSLRTHNPAPPGYLGSMVVGTITTSAGNAVVNNAGAILPNLLTATTQGGVVVHLTVCAGSSAQTLPAGSIVTWSLIAP